MADVNIKVSIQTFDTLGKKIILHHENILAFFCKHNSLGQETPNDIQFIFQLLTQLKLF